MNYDEIKKHFYNAGGFTQLLDMQITDISEGYCKGEMPVKESAVATASPAAPPKANMPLTARTQSTISYPPATQKS